MIFGLGNYGKSYDYTRHNVSYFFFDYLIIKHNLEVVEFEKYEYSIFEPEDQNMLNEAKPSKYVLLRVKSDLNDAGPLLKSILETDFKDQFSDLKILSDDLETEFGQTKISKIGGDRGHNGIKSIMSAFGHNTFEKIKIGIGRPKSRDTEVVCDYVLAEFNRIEREILEIETFPKIEDYLSRSCQKL